MTKLLIIFILFFLSGCAQQAVEKSSEAPHQGSTWMDVLVESVKGDDHLSHLRMGYLVKVFSSDNDYPIARWAMDVRSKNISIFSGIEMHLITEDGKTHTEWFPSSL